MDQYLIGLTGNIATGKSTVANMLADLGATVIDADALVHDLQRKGTPVYDDIVAAFGPGILDPAGRSIGRCWGRLCLRILRNSAGWKASYIRRS
jgi:dephospho-CoA kinase